MIQIKGDNSATCNGTNFDRSTLYATVHVVYVLQNCVGSSGWNSSTDKTGFIVKRVPDGPKRVPLNRTNDWCVRLPFGTVRPYWAGYNLGE